MHDETIKIDAEINILKGECNKLLEEQLKIQKCVPLDRNELEEHSTYSDDAGPHQGCSVLTQVQLRPSDCSRKKDRTVRRLRRRKIKRIRRIGRRRKRRKRKILKRQQRTNQLIKKNPKQPFQVRYTSPWFVYLL